MTVLLVHHFRDVCPKPVQDFRMVLQCKIKALNTLSLLGQTRTFSFVKVGRQTLLN